MGTILTYRGSGVVNFAQGAMATFPALVFVELRADRRPRAAHRRPAEPHPPRRADGHRSRRSILALLVAALIGLLADLLIFRHLRSATPLAKVIASVGLSSVLVGLSVLHFGAAPRTGPPILPAGTVAGVRPSRSRRTASGSPAS